MLSHASSRSSSSLISSSSSTEELVERTHEKRKRAPTVVSSASSSTKKADSYTSAQENALQRSDGPVNNIAENSRKNASSSRPQAPHVAIKPGAFYFDDEKKPTAEKPKYKASGKQPDSSNAATWSEKEDAPKKEPAAPIAPSALTPGAIVTAHGSTTQELTTSGFPLDIWFEILDRMEEAAWTQTNVRNLNALSRTSKSFGELVKTFVAGRPELSIQINRLFSEAKISAIATSRIAKLANINRRASDFRKAMWRVSEAPPFGAVAMPIIGAFALASAAIHTMRKNEIKIKMIEVKNRRDVKFTLSEVRQHDLKALLSCAIKGKGTLLVDASLRRGQSCDSVINALWMLNFFIGKYGTSREVYIELIGSELSDQHLTEISQLPNHGFTSVDFSDNKLNDIAITIANLLPKWDLKRLILSNNRVSDSGVLALAKALSIETDKKPVLTELRLDGNPVSPTGALALANALKTNSTLSVLSLSVEAIDARAAKAMLEALMVKATPFKLILVGKLDDSIKEIFDKSKLPKQVRIEYVPDKD